MAEISKEIFEANRRLLRMREETAAEDQGHLRNISQMSRPISQTTSERPRPLESGSSSGKFKKVRYINGISYGMTHRLRADIADDLIRRGYAEAV